MSSKIRMSIKPIDNISKNLKRGLVALLVLLALIAPLTELFLYSHSSKASVVTELETDSLQYVDFDQYNERTLAKNSHFDYYFDEPADVYSISLRMSIEESELTEKVVYFTGVKDSVLGEYVTALTRDENGYTAVLSAQNITAIKVFPSETVNATIKVQAISVNHQKAKEFSYDRALLESMLIVTFTVWLVNIVYFCQKKKALFAIPFAVWLLFSTIVCLVGFEAGALFSVARQLGRKLVPIVFVVVSMIFWICYAVVFRIKKLHHKAFALLMLIGVCFAFANAPLQAPDENAHFLRAYAMAEGALDFNYAQDFPGDVQLLLNEFPGEFYNNIHDTELGTVIGSIKRYMSSATEKQGTTVVIPTTIHLLLPYVFSSVAIAVSRLFGANALICLYAGRIANVLAYSGAVCVALSMARKYRISLLTVSFLPLTVYIASSLSYDSMFLAAFVLFIGALLSDTFSKKQFIISLLSFGIMIMIKPIYFPLIVLIILINNWSLKIRKPVYILILVFFAISFWGTSEGYAVAMIRGEAIEGQALWGVDYLAQAVHLLATPIRYAVTLCVDSYLKVFYLNQYGLFGCLDVSLPITGFVTPIAIVVLSLLSANQEKGKTKNAVVSAAITIFMYLLIVTSFYISWSTLGSTSVLGVQVRYFIPFVFTSSIALSHLSEQMIVIKGDVEKHENATFLVMGFMLWIAVFELAIAYFLM